MTSQLELDRRQMLGGIALGLGGAMLAACGSRAGAQGGDLACAPTPTETRGPFPADGSNGRPRPINVLGDGRHRAARHPRRASPGWQGRADGVPLELELTLVGAAPAASRWPATRSTCGRTTRRATTRSTTCTDANYLRGLQAADARGPGPLHQHRAGLLRRALSALPFRGVRKRRGGDRRRAAAAGLAARLSRSRVPRDLSRRCALRRQPAQPRAPADRRAISCSATPSARGQLRRSAHAAADPAARLSRHGDDRRLARCSRNGGR